MILGIPARPGLRVMVASKPIDFRKGMDGLASLVTQLLLADPFAGDVFIFRAKRTDRLKLILWDGSGLCMVTKRLEARGFSTWVAQFRAQFEPGEGLNVVAVDGKTSRRTHHRAKGREPLHMLCAWACEQRLVIGQQATAAKANEASTIPLLLERLQLQGALVTIDAAGATTKIAKTVLARGADYLLGLKQNRPALFAETEALFSDPALSFEEAVTAEVAHGRTERRRHVVCHDASWINPTHWESDSVRFPGVAMVGMVERTITRQGKTSCERHYYLCSTRLDPVTFGRAVRAHWGIENRLHWTLDVVFHDDLARLRSDNAPENMAIIKHMASNLLRGTKPTMSLKNRLKMAGWSPDYLANVLKGYA